MGLIMINGTFKRFSYKIMAIFFYLSYIFPVNSFKILLIMTHDESDEGNVGSMAKFLSEKNQNLVFKKVTKENYSFNLNKYLFKNLIFMFIVLPYHMATSSVIFMDNVFLPFSSIKVKKNTRLVQLWHGTGAIKKFGLDSEEGWIKKKAIKVNTNTSHFIVGSSWMGEIYKSAFGATEDRIFNIGCPRTDLFFDKESISIKKREFLKKYSELAGKQIILYAPTFRDEELGNEIKTKLNVEKLLSELNEDYILGFRLHPVLSDKFNLDKMGLSADHQKRVFDFSDYENLNTLLFNCDILITDYSSILFEYALLKKPMIFFSYDLDKFEKSGRGFYEDYESMVPGPVVFETLEIADEINKINSDKSNNNNNNNFSFNLGKFISIYLETCDGNSRKRLYDLLIKN